jgi:RNA polymerase sigma factor (sigma-70 family)
MSGDSSISVWLEEVKSGDHEAAGRLWQRYFPLIVRLAQKQLAEVPRRLEDEEDVALSVFDSFCRAADRGRFPHVTDRESLWRLLCRITHFKAVDLVRRSQRAMGDANVRGESGFQADGTSMNRPISSLARVETTADFAAMVADEVQRLLQMLPEEELRTIAVARMEGYTNREIADRLGCAERTIERRMKYIRAIWRDEFPQNQD